MKREYFTELSQTLLFVRENLLEISNMLLITRAISLFLTGVLCVLSIGLEKGSFMGCLASRTYPKLRKLAGVTICVGIAIYFILNVIQ